ncbi:STAS domain-containing protein [Actimicrobium sp. CCI2.3]|uniref:STAS domain-containing protein n=1 Tax=Actimicrobium sp. CCI2.3 TaxID=3048616 RepID=UPI002AB32DC7|nr:STAS domain-containing protein [Actimicrobium sp. CCI2.3]MDY7574818.1 STAS domain-containing protein [Actimicrobium sp. CCI2.3]MEB0020221.1 STAS domain-containing protein [Actimicrobium sp. CCI2.3]
MNLHHLAALDRLLSEQRTVLHEKWVAEILTSWSSLLPNTFNVDEMRQHTALLLEEIAKIFSAYPESGLWEFGETHPLVLAMSEFSASRAVSGFTPTETAQYVMCLKSVLTLALIHELMSSPVEMKVNLAAVEDVIGRLTLVTFSAFVETRERVILQQSASLVELSTPVIRLWDHVLLLPLVGVIDTARARKFTENLLEAITRYEASVTVIDVTGVPIFDISVARHLMKTVDAAQLLGTRVVMTGLNPDGALTLTKLGISLPNVITRATLRSGVAEALSLINRRIVPVASSRS